MVPSPGDGEAPEAAPEEILTAALAYIRLGFSVIPVHRDKRPAIKEWKSYQTERTTEAQAQAWWGTDDPVSVGIAILAGAISGIVVLDWDAKTHPGKEFPLADFPQNPVARTQHGGAHVYYRHPGKHVKNDLKRDGWDVRGDGGYVVAAPSPGYSFVTPLCDPKKMPLPPAWVSEPPTPAVDQPTKRWEEALGDVPQGAQDEHLISLAGKVVQAMRGQPKDLVRLAVIGALQQRASTWAQDPGDPWTEEDFERHFDSAWGEDEENHGKVRGGRLSIAEIFATARTLEDRLTDPLPAKEPLIPHLVYPSSRTQVFGPTGVGKTTLITQVFLASAIARWAVLGNRVTAMAEDLPISKRPLRVLYIGPEDSPEMYESARLPQAVAEAYREAGRGFTYINKRITLAGEGEQLDEFIAHVLWMPEGPEVVIFDTISRVYVGLDENDHGDMSRVMEAFERINDRTGASITFTHHMTKYGSRMIRGNKTVREDPTQSRGASVLSDQSHVVLSLSKGQDRQSIVLTWAKSNYALLRPPVAFQRTEDGLFIPVKADTRLWQLRDLLGEDPVRREDLAKAVEAKFGVKRTQAYSLVGKALDTRMIVQVDEEGDPDERGEYVVLYQRG